MDTNKRPETEIGRSGSSAFEGAFNFPLFRRLGREIDFLFDRFGLERALFEPAATVWTPDLEMFRRGDTVVIRADVPGMKKDDFTVEIVDGQVFLRGERKQEMEEKKDNYYRAERTYGAFVRVLPLPEGVKVDEAKAALHDGVLEITLPTTKLEQMKRALVIEEPGPAAATKAA